MAGDQPNFVYTNYWYNLASEFGVQRQGRYATGSTQMLRHGCRGAALWSRGTTARYVAVGIRPLHSLAGRGSERHGCSCERPATWRLQSQAGCCSWTLALLAQADALQTRIKAVARQQATTIRVGAIDTAAVGLLPLLLNDYQRECPDVKVDVLEDKTPRLLQRVLSGRLDLAFVRPPLSRDRNLEFRHLFYETAIVAVPSRNELARIKSVSIKDVAQQPLIVPDKRSRPHSHNLTIKLFTEAGVEPQIAQVADEKQTIVNLVSAGLGIAILPRWTSRMKVKGDSYIRLRVSKGATRNILPLAAAWVRGSRDPLRSSFLNVLSTNIDRYSAEA